MTPANNQSRTAAVLYAIIPLAIFAFSHVLLYSGLFFFLRAPIIIVLLVERRNLETLGFTLKLDQLGRYAVYLAHTLPAYTLWLFRFQCNRRWGSCIRGRPNLGWQLIKTKSLFPSVVAHIGQNLFGRMLIALVLRG